MFTKKLKLAIAAIGLIFVTNNNATAQQSFPDKPIRIIVPFPAGGSTDALGRIFADKLSGLLDTPVIAENVAGVSGSIAARQVSSEKPDGYTILLGTSTNLVMYPLVSKNVSYDTLRDFDPVFLAVDLPSVVVVNPELNVHDMAGLRSHLEKNPNDGSYATAGVGTPGHLAAELYRLKTGLPLNHVPFQGGAPALLAVAGGHVKLSIAVLPDAIPYIQGDRLRALATTTAQRPTSMPDTPTVTEAGIPGFDVYSSYGFVVPKGVPTSIIEKLNQAFQEAMKQPDTQEKLKNLGFELRGGSPQDFGKVIEQQKEMWEKVIKDANIIIG